MTFDTRRNIILAFDRDIELFLNRFKLLYCVQNWIYIQHHLKSRKKPSECSDGILVETWKISPITVALTIFV